jgi:3-hydroxyacyl-CoA dehydrogenase
VIERLAIAGSGAIACGLAATAARHGEVLLVVRSEESAGRARQSVDRICGRLSGEVNAAHVEIVTRENAAGLGSATFVIEAVIEDHDVKALVLANLHRQRPSRALRRPARVQPRAQDEARRARVPHRRHPGHPRSRSGDV